jgi:predicted DNA-binding antitoxin AbrB/MazE fold protein
MADEPKTVTLKDGEKVYTQAELDKMFAERADRATKAAEESAQKKIAEMEGKLTAANAQADALKKTSVSVEEANKALEETYKGITDGMDDKLKGLIPEALPIAERIKHINKNREVFFPKPAAPGTPPAITPIVPNANGEPNTPPVATTKTPLPAQYGTVAEFQIKDPRGFAKWREDNRT